MRPRRSRKLGKRQLERAQRVFADAVNAELDALGAVFDGSFHHMLPTRAGLLLARAVPSVLGPGGFVALRFEDVDAAKKLLGSRGLAWDLNPYSGKWNLNLYSDEYGEDGAARIRAALRHRLSLVALPDEVSEEDRRRRLEVWIGEREVRIAQFRDAVVGKENES